MEKHYKTVVSGEQADLKAIFDLDDELYEHFN